ncbi:MAG: hypothetical protein ACO3HG_06210, partial [Schleiferiaceae bacterium]
MKYFIYCLALCMPMVSLAQVQKDVRIEKRVFVVKDGKMLEQPNDSIFRELRINIDSLAEGTTLNGDFGGAGNGNVMIFR